LGRYRDAVDALRYGREVDPRTAAFYDLLAAAYSAQGELQRAAATVLEKVLLLGASRETLEQVARIYGDSSCAVERGSGWMRLNESCPQIQADLCTAQRDLVDMLTQARLSETASQFADRAQKSGCKTQK
jgi:hypothetical protein